MLKLRPLYVRFFGVSENHVSRVVASILDQQDIYFIHVERYEVVLKLVRSSESPIQIKRLLLDRFGRAFIGCGKNNSIELIVGRKLIKKHLSITGAESLTAGMFQATLGNVPGISAVFPGGFVTYSNHAKHHLLGIPTHVIDTYGVVSKAVANWMACQSRRIMQTDISVSFTGAAGPTSLEGHPAGTVWIGVSLKNHKPIARLYHLMPLYQALVGFRSIRSIKRNSRNAIRLLSVKTGLELVNEMIS